MLRSTVKKFAVRELVLKIEEGIRLVEKRDSKWQYFCLLKEYNPEYAGVEPTVLTEFVRYLFPEKKGW